MNKKFYLGALALPLMMAACSSEDTLSEVQGVKDQYEGIAKVDATFTLDGAQSRLANELGLEVGDKIGMAWLGVPADAGLYGPNALTGENGWAYQNHPLKATSTTSLKPETSIYVGKYFIYHPYDAGTQQLKNIAFDIAEQPLTEDYNATGRKSIYLSSELTNVTLDGDINGKNEAGEECRFDVKARQLTNLVGLEAAWKNNDVLEEEIEAPIIDSIMVGYKVGENVTSAIGFEYAPKNFENGYNVELDGKDYWGHYNLLWESADATPAEPMSRVAAEKNRIIKLKTPGIYATGFEEIETGMIKLEAAEGGYTVEGENAKFFYNALPATEKSTEISLRVLTDYGVIDYTLAMNEAAMTADYKTDATAYMDNFDGSQEISENDQIKSLEGEAEEVLTAVPVEGSFMNRLYKSGKILAQIDFFDAKIDGMHVKNDAHLQKLLNFHILKTAAGQQYAETDVQLYLDADATTGDFEISKESIALVQQINANVESSDVVELLLCDVPHNGKTPRIVVFNNGTDLEVPNMNKVFGEFVNVYLKDQDWTWGGTLSRAVVSKAFGRVSSITNLGTLDVNGDMNYNSSNKDKFSIENKNVINVNVKMEANININNHATMNVKDDAEFWAGNGYTLINTAVSLEVFGVINNEGVLTVTEKGTAEAGDIINYGLINHKSSETNANVKTYITANQTREASFISPFADNNKFGTIMLSNKFDNVSVSNATQEGFIKYAWNAAEDAKNEENIYQTPTSTYYKVKYNYLIVDQNIKFVENESELKFLEVAAGKDVIIAAEKAEDNSWRGIAFTGLILGEQAEANIQLKNRVKVKGAYITNGTVRVGGEFEYETLATYLGGSAADNKNIGKY